MDPREDNQDFKEGLKTTGLFGGVQVFNILIGMVRAKIVAILLGPEGYGIMGLLSSTTGLIGSVTNLGIGTSAVRDVAKSFATGNHYQFSRTVRVMRRLVWLTGSLGLLVCLLFSPLWSQLSFGNYAYTLSFAILSTTFLISQISSGQSVVLQGSRRFKRMAKSGVTGSILGLITTLPFYYFWGLDGIVPAMLVSSIMGLLMTFYYTHNIKIEKIPLTLHETLHDGKLMMKLGFFLSLQSFLNLLCAYIVRIYISHTGGVADVGLYNSGFSVINQYVGLVFAAMGTEYFPRLSSISDDTKKFTHAINQQIEVSILIVAPLIAVFLAMGEAIILILYSERFMPVAIMISLGIFGVLFKAPSWCLGYSFIAKGDTKAFFVNELVAEVVGVILNISFYYIWGLNGLGLSFVIWYIIYLAQVFAVTKYRYDYVFDKSILIVFIPQIIICGIILAFVILLKGWIRYVTCAPFVLLSFYIAFKALSKHVDVLAYIRSKLNR